MKIALISHHFPTELKPFSGKFINDQLSLFENDDTVSVDLINPTPYSFPFTRRYKKNHSNLLFKGEKKKLYYLSFPKKRFPKIIKYFLSKAIKKHFEDRDYDLVHLHWMYPEALSIPVLKELGFKCVLTVHGSDWYENAGNPKLMEIFREVLKKTDRVLTSGPKLKNDMKESFPFLEGKIEVIFNMVDENLYTLPKKEEKEAAKEKLGWDKDKIHALTVANIRHEKGVDVLVDAVRDEEAFSEVQFNVIGGQDGNGYTKSIRQSVKNNSIQNIRLYGGLPPHQLVPFYHAADFLVLTSRREGFNVSVLEAMACGLPVVYTKVGGSKYVIHDKTGILAEVDSPDDVKRAISEMLIKINDYDPKEIRDSVILKYGLPAFKDRLMEQYRKV